MAADGSTGSGMNFPDLTQLFKRTDIGFAVAIVAILVVLIFPIPSFLLDFLLAISITFSVMVLMTSLFIEKPLEFSAFPTVLLIATMLRLSLNLASTRLILAHGHEGPSAAGSVIESFGSFVMSGNFVIGLIVFGILVLVNFIVITKGSGRIAEVSARFTLDAMPGKQMAIDADLSAGMINEDEARERRKELEKESGFFGAMDGASKFVRGDAIAGLLITFINVIGGMVIGVAQMGLSAGEAAESYTLLTVGDGLVSQIPALLVSTAAGLLVSKAGVTGSAEQALISQLGSHPKALGVSSGLLVTIAFLPGMPALPFLLLGGLTGAGAYYLPKWRAEDKAQAEMALAAEEPPPKPEEEPISKSLHIDNVRLELGYGLLSLVNAEGGNFLTNQIKSLRRQLAQEMGFIMPAIRIQDNMQLPSNSYMVRVKEIEAGKGDIRPNMLLVMDARGEKITLPGEATIEPTFGLPAMWIDEKYREEALFKGYTVVEASTVLTTHITEIIKDYTHELLSYAETQKLLDELPGNQQKLVGDVIPSQCTLGTLQRILQTLLSERISIRDLPTILEGIAEATGYTRNITMIAEHVRMRLARQISDSNTSAAGFIPIVTMSPEWEQAFVESLLGDGEERQLAMPPNQLQEFITKVRKTYEEFGMKGESPILLTSPTTRPYVRSIIERFRPSTVVMSQNEIHPKASIKTLGKI